MQSNQRIRSLILLPGRLRRSVKRAAEDPTTLHTSNEKRAQKTMRP